MAWGRWRSATGASAGAQGVTVVKVKLASQQTAALGVRRFTATVLDSKGDVVPGASLDIGGLADDPDLRVTTTAMNATARPGQYEATVTYPADGDWMMVIRVHTPSQYVELFTTNIPDGPARADHHDLSGNPSKRAVLADDPTFYARYDPYLANAGTPNASAVAATSGNGATGTAGAGAAADGTRGHVAGLATAAVGRSDPFDLSVALMALVHTGGAAAWLISVLGLALANRLGPGVARNDSVRFISTRYRMLAGGGLVVTALSGVVMVQKGSAGLLQPRQLLSTGVGTAYLAVFAVKMVLVAVSLLTTFRVAGLLAPYGSAALRPIVASVGAQGDDGPPRRALALTELNLLLGVLIIGCVAILGQLHHLLY